MTFTARDQRNAYVELEKVVITDVTQNWQDTIYYPDTVYVMETVGIDDYDGKLPFALSQNAPNPFAGITDITLQMPVAGKVYVEVNDIYGHKITAYNSLLQAGKHTLRVAVLEVEDVFRNYVTHAVCPFLPPCADSIGKGRKAEGRFVGGAVVWYGRKKCDDQ